VETLIKEILISTVGDCGADCHIKNFLPRTLGPKVPLDGISLKPFS
jgi:hypothetical protein